MWSDTPSSTSTSTSRPPARTAYKLWHAQGQLSLRVRGVTVAAASGKDAAPGSRPAVSTLQRKTKEWLQQELRLRGIDPPAGTKAVLAAELHKAWDAPAGPVGADGGPKKAAAARKKRSAKDGKPPANQTRKEDGTEARRAELVQELNLMKVAQLQEELAALGLPKSGKKALLVDRLVQARFPAPAEQEQKPPLPATPKKKRAPTNGAASRTQQAPAPAVLQQELERLRTEVRQREEALAELHGKLMAAESAQIVDRGLLKEMQESVRALQDQRRKGRESLGGRSLEQLRAAAGEMEARLKPGMEAQIEELEAIVEGLEQETALKADVVRELAESLDRSLAAPDAIKGQPGPDEPEQQESGETGGAGVSAASQAQAPSAPRSGEPQKRNPFISNSGDADRPGPGSIGIALAAGVISALKGLSLPFSIGQSPQPTSPKSRNSIDDDKTAR